MTLNQIKSLASMLESVWPKTYYHKDHDSLVTAITTMLADVDGAKVLAIVRDFANNNDTAPTIGNIVRLVRLKEDARTSGAPAKYFEDFEGCGYMYNEAEQTYDCIWKYWWADKGRSKLATLRKHGVINYDTTM